MSDDDEIRIRTKRDPDKPISALDRLVFAKWAEFAWRLLTRQGTVAPNFKSLYKRKAELDRQLLGEPPSHDSRL